MSILSKIVKGLGGSKLKGAVKRKKAMADKGTDVRYDSLGSAFKKTGKKCKIK